MVYEFYHALDPFLIAPFRLSANPFLGYLLGNLCLALLCTVVGELTLALILRVNGKHIQEQNLEMMRNQSLSIQALMHKSKEQYKAANALANEAFGKTFFAGLALFSSTLWPVPFILGWLGLRFGHLDFELLFPFPLLGDTVQYSAVFLLIYVLTRLMTAKARKLIFAYEQTPSAEREKQADFYTWKDVHASKNISTGSGNET